MCFFTVLVMEDTRVKKLGLGQATAQSRLDNTELRGKEDEAVENTGQGPGHSREGS